MSFGFSIFPESLRWLWRDYPGVISEGIVNSSSETVIGEWDIETIVWDVKLSNVLTLTTSDGKLSATFTDQNNNQFDGALGADDEGMMIDYPMKGKRN